MSGLNLIPGPCPHGLVPPNEAHARLHSSSRAAPEAPTRDPWFRAHGKMDAGSPLQAASGMTKWKMPPASFHGLVSPEEDMPVLEAAFCLLSLTLSLSKG